MTSLPIAHELLAALTLKPGSSDLFRLLQDPQDSCAQWLHPWEADFLKQHWLPMQKLFAELKRFAAVRLSFLYRQTVQISVQSLLDEYQAEILNLESTLIRKTATAQSLEQELILSRLRTLFNEYRPLFMQILAVTKAKKESTSTDSKQSTVHWMDVVDQSLRSATLTSREYQFWLMTQRRLHQVFYQQLISWLFYGHVSDPNNEFFIAIMNNEEVVLRLDRLPRCFPVHLAKMCYYLGRVVQTVRLSEHRGAQQESVRQLHGLVPVYNRQIMELFSDEHERFQDYFALERILSAYYAQISTILFKLVSVQCQLSEYCRAFRDYFLVGRGEFFDAFLLELDQFILKSTGEDNLNGDTVKPVQIAEYEINSMLKRAALKTSAEDDWALDRFKFRLIQHEGQKPAIHSNDSEADVIHRISAWELCSSFLLPGNSQSLELQFNFMQDDPVLQWIFTEQDLADYNALFSLLIALKYSQLKLHRIWKTVKVYEVQKHAVLGRVIGAVRHHLHSLLETLSFYFHNDVIDVHFRHFEGIITSLMTESEQSIAIDGEIQTIHRRHFLSPVLTKLFARSSKIMESVHDLLKLTDDFCRQIMRWDRERAVSETVYLRRVADFEKRLIKISGYLFRGLCAVSEAVGGQTQARAPTMPELRKSRYDLSLNRFQSGMRLKDETALPNLPNHLDQLLLKLDFNKFYSVAQSNP